MAKTKTKINTKKKESNSIIKLGNNIVTNLKAHWKPIVWILGPLVVLTIIFALPIKTVPIQTTETYWDTEMKQEPYTVTEPYTDTETQTTTEMQTKTVYDSYVDAGNWSYTFNVDKANSKVNINFYGFPYPAYPQCDVVCTTSEASSCRVFCVPYPYGGTGKVLIKLTYPADVTRQQQVTKYREVIKYREVPIQVLKERTVTQNVRMSLWGYIFR